MTYAETVCSRISNLDDFNATHLDAEQMSYIKSKLLHAIFGRWTFETKSDVEVVVYSECDPLEHIESLEEGDKLYDAIRGIQFDIRALHDQTEVNVFVAGAK